MGIAVGELGQETSSMGFGDWLWRDKEWVNRLGIEQVGIRESGSGCFWAWRRCKRVLPLPCPGVLSQSCVLRVAHA